MTSAARSEAAGGGLTAADRPVDTRAATLRAVYVIWRRDLIRYWRDRSRLVASFAQPLLFLLVFGTGLTSALRGAGGAFGRGLSYQLFIYPGVIAMAVLFNAIFGAMSIVWDREFGFLKEMLVAPIDRSAVALGKTLGGATQASLQGMVLLLLSPLIGVRLTPLALAQMVALIFCLALALAALGVAVASQMRSMQGFMFVVNFVAQPAFFLSGALFPITGLPTWLTVLTRLDPVAYGVDPLRQVVLETSGTPPAALDRLALTVLGQALPVPAEVAVLIGFAGLMTSLAVLSFRRQE